MISELEESEIDERVNQMKRLKREMENNDKCEVLKRDIVEYVRIEDKEECPTKVSIFTGREELIE